MSCGEDPEFVEQRGTTNVKILSFFKNCSLNTQRPMDTPSSACEKKKNNESNSTVTLWFTCCCWWCCTFSSISDIKCEWKLVYNNNNNNNNNHSTYMPSPFTWIGNSFSIAVKAFLATIGYFIWRWLVTAIVTEGGKNNWISWFVRDSCRVNCLLGTTNVVYSTVSVWTSTRIYTFPVFHTNARLGNLNFLTCHPN